MSLAERHALFDNTARSLSGAPFEIQQRHIAHCNQADPAYGAGVEHALRNLALATALLGPADKEPA